MFFLSVLVGVVVGIFVVIPIINKIEDFFSDRD
jgi:hypothetical protein